MTNKQPDRNTQRPQQDQGGTRQKSDTDQELDRKAQTDKGMGDEDVEDADKTGDDEQ